MLAATTKDLTTPTELLEAASPESGPSAVVSDSARPDTPSVAKLKTKQSRPRPCFDDGALTRIFKFPSKSYPRSTYYVTSDEFIIRIKKAKKKWKLVVPKKRVVSYKTNRWFAKPRWIELELTFTQASRLGLIEPRKPAKDGASEPEAASQIAHMSVPPVDTQAVLTPQANHDLATPQDSPIGPAVETDDDTSEVRMEDDTSDFDLVSDTSDDGELDDDEHTAPPDAPQANDVLPAALMDADPLRLQPAPPIVSEQLRPAEAHSVAPPPSARRSHRSMGVLMSMGLALLLVSTAGVWLTLNGGPDAMTAESGRDQISIVHTVPAQDLPAVPVIVADSIERSVTQNSQGVPTPLQATDQLEAQPIVTGSLAQPSPPPIAPEPELRAPPPTVPTEPMTASPSPRERSAPPDSHRCSELAATAQSMTISFDYASPVLDRSLLASLSALASWLQACPSVAVVIEGHTDSDGHENRNEALSWRRAEAVHQHLIAAGVKPAQLSVIGLGQSRPAVPNVTNDNKRRNRRVVLVAEQQP